MIILALLFSFMGIVLLCIGFKQKMLIKNTERCVQLNAEIVDYKKEIRYRKGAGGSKFRSVSYFPIYKYYYRGEERTYTARASRGNKKEGEIGTHVTLFFDMKKENVFAGSEKRLNLFAGSLLCIIGLFMILYLTEFYKYFI